MPAHVYAHTGNPIKKCSCTLQGWEALRVAQGFEGAPEGGRELKGASWREGGREEGKKCITVCF